MRILFVHGLEGTSQGSKSNFLRAEFGEENVFVEEMHSGLFDFRKQNSVARYLVVNPEIFVWLIGACLPIFLGLELEIYLLPYLSIFIFLFFILIRVPRLLRSAVKNMFMGCVEIQALALKKHEPDIIVGSSLGGAVIVEILRREWFTGKLLLGHKIF